MKRKSELNPAWVVVDYSAARADAIRRLGDRYLLARPINRKHDGRRKLTATHRSMPVDINGRALNREQPELASSESLRGVFRREAGSG